MPSHHSSEDSEHSGDDSDSHPRHEPKLSHEFIAAAAGAAAFHELQKRQREQGHPVSHELAKTLLAGFAAAKIDKLLETRGRDAWDARLAKEEAKKKSHELYEREYMSDHGDHHHHHSRRNSHTEDQRSEF